MYSLRRFTISASLIASFAAISAVHAQAPGTPDTATVKTAAVADTTSRSGPRLAPVGIQRVPAQFEGLRNGQPVSMGKPVALMIVGLAAFVLGAMIGQEVGTLFMIGGALSLLIGLYQYIK